MTLLTLSLPHQATTELYPLSLHDALPIFTWACGTLKSVDPGYDAPGNAPPSSPTNISREEVVQLIAAVTQNFVKYAGNPPDRKSTRLNSSHLGISYAVFCLQKTKNN